jgi:hypothetical protein
MPYTKKVVARTQPPHRPIVAAQHLFQPHIAAARHLRSSISHPQPRHQLTTHSRRSDSLPQSPRQPLDVGTPLPESASSSPCRPRWSLQHRCSRLTSISAAATLVRLGASRWSLPSSRCSVSTALPDLAASPGSHPAPAPPSPPFLGLRRLPPAKIELGARRPPDAPPSLTTIGSHVLIAFQILGHLL